MKLVIPASDRGGGEEGKVENLGNRDQMDSFYSNFWPISVFVGYPYICPAPKAGKAVVKAGVELAQKHKECRQDGASSWERSNVIS